MNEYMLIVDIMWPGGRKPVEAPKISIRNDGVWRFQTAR
jgi:hypothetical protein